MNRILRGAVLLCVLALPAFGAEDAKPEGEKIDMLIKQLRAEDGDRREAARRELTELGEPARAPLEKALAKVKNDPDFSAQVKLILKSLGQSEALSGFDRPATIDLEVTDATVKEVVEKLQAAFGCEIPVGVAVEETKVSLALRGARLFQALEALREAGNLAYQVDNNRLWGGGKQGDEKKLPIELTAREENTFSVSGWAGPFLLLVQNVSYQEHRTLQIAQPKQDNRSFSLQMVAVPEPGLTLSETEPEGSVFTDANGKEIAGIYNKDNPQFRHRHWRHRNRQRDYVQFNDQIQKADELSGPLTWKAQLKVSVPLLIKSKTIENLSAQDQHSVPTPEGTVSVQKPVKEDRGWELRITVPAKSRMAEGGFGSGAFAMAIGGGERPKPPENEAGLFVLNAAGEIIHSGGMSGSGNGTTMEYTMTYQEQPVSVLVRWEAEKAERKVDAVIKGIPVP